jgi:hypothetical protein
VAATAELASIADAGEAWHDPRRSATSLRRNPTLRAVLFWGG